MSYVSFKQKTVTAKARRRCIWCPQMIEAGSEYIRYAGLQYGKIQAIDFHPECLAAMNSLPGKEAEIIFPHESKRGSTEHV